MNHKTKLKQVLLAATSFLVAALAMDAADSRTYVIQNAKVHTLSTAGILPRASVVLVDGKIAAVGASVKIPSGAQILKGDGLEVYPGMIDAWSDVGLTEIPAVEVTNDANEMGDFKPQLLAYSAIHPASEHIPVARANGITTALSAPGGGIIAGQAALIHLDGWTVDEMAVARSAGMVLNFPSLEGRRSFARMGFGRLGQSRTFSEIKRDYENKLRELSEWLEKARHYARAREANTSTEADRQLEALVPVVKSEMTVFVSADSARDIRNAVEFGVKEQLKMVIVGGRESNKAADLLKKENIPVILGSIVTLPARQDDPYDAPFTLPSELAKAGIKFALTSPRSSEIRNLPYEAGFAQAYGLSHEEALKAVTLYPAEILGVADRIGSIEAGKIADLVVTDGDLLEIRTQVKNLFIAGRSVSLESRHTRLYQKYLSRP